MVPGWGYSLSIGELDTLYLEWIVWLMSPLIVTLLLPFGILMMLYTCAFLIQIFHLRGYLFNISHANTHTSAIKLLATLWTAHGKIWHGYEVEGLDNLPDEGPALIIYYHAALPVDLYYLLATIYSKKNRVVYCVGDNLLYKIPGFRKMMTELNVIPGTVASCSDLLKSGNLMAIAPGGVREALFSDEYYSLMWGKRKGFGRVIKEARVPVVPVFTKNSREAFRTFGIFKRIFRSIYEKYRLPIVPIYGGFPVKLRTILGHPIHFNEAATVEQIVEEVKSSLEELISKHQKIPGNILGSILERLYQKRY